MKNHDFWNDFALENNGLLHFPVEKRHLLRNFNSAKVCEGALGRWQPQEVDVDPQSQGMEAEGRVSSRAHACINEESFLSCLKKKNRNWFWIWSKVYCTIKDIYGFCHQASIFLLLVLVSSCHPGKSPLSFLSPIMIMIELNSSPIPGVDMWLRPGQSEHCFPPDVLILSNQWQFGSCRGGRLAWDRGGAGERRQISGNPMLDPALPEDRNYLCTL